MWISMHINLGLSKSPCPGVSVSSSDRTDTIPTQDTSELLSPRTQGNLGLIVSDYRLLRLTVLVRTLNILRYGLVVASLSLLYAIIPFLKQKSYDVIHCQLSTLSQNALLLI
jgi:colanic acid/amylovoran biosynthesis glycosyltransferase